MKSTDAAAILAAINAKFSTKRAYEHGDPALPSLTTYHVLVMVFRRYVPERRASGEVTMPGGRVVTRYIVPIQGLASPMTALRLLRDQTAAALEDQILPGDVGPFTFESADVVDEDEGWLVQQDTWTY